MPAHDSFYLAEENSLNMDRYEVPHAEKIYYDDNLVKHETELDLEEDSAGGKVSDWKTGWNELENTEQVVFTNTLKEQNLEVIKQWADSDTNDHAQDDLKIWISASFEKTKFLNTPGVELPATGGRALWYTVFGLTMMTASGIALTVHSIRKKKLAE